MKRHLDFRGSARALRSFIFPFTLRGAATTPLLPTVTAVGFCSLNGFFQAHSIVHDSNPDSENCWRMLSGESELKMKYILTFNLNILTRVRFKLAVQHGTISYVYEITIP